MESYMDWLPSELIKYIYSLNSARIINDAWRCYKMKKTVAIQLLKKLNLEEIDIMNQNTYNIMEYCHKFLSKNNYYLLNDNDYTLYNEILFKIFTVILEAPFADQSYYIKIQNLVNTYLHKLDFSDEHIADVDISYKGEPQLR